ncbi:phosphoribosylglycinamide formyltransferase [Tenacibaculum aiptasiae]|uniref:phosphoribosylglycinamide formyltransferase n=1 Tax=Tenacibaculum aiptasiae TaxID=426481 RepID=UPI00232B701F|nr:formyltransferase family protein [Tenacibaculum aiptasiae]
MKKFAVFYSGYGRGVKEIIKDYLNGYLEPELALVFTTNPDTDAFELAKKSGIKTFFLDKRSFQSHKEFEKRILTVLKKEKIDYIFLAGYGFLIRETLLNEYKEKIVNIHPSLLPVFKGLNALQQALEYGVKIVGITTHVVDEGLDTGRILYQEAISVEADDFKQLEYRVFKIGTTLQVKTINRYFI